jgi:hypothetical protein
LKPITVFIEIEEFGRPFDWRGGSFKGRFKDGVFRRVWWGNWAIAWVRMDLHDYNQYVASGATEWRKS